MGFYLGIDASTQGMKALLIDSVNVAVSEPVSVNFGRDLPEYHSPQGFLIVNDPYRKHADPLMWLEALDLLFTRIKAAGWPLQEIEGISGSAQQHGSVYLNESFVQKLKELSDAETLKEHFLHCFSQETAPIWMDQSTTKECAELRLRFGKELQDRTGSPAIERFTCSQIRKFSTDFPLAWTQTSCVHLVSSFLASVLGGVSAPVDYGDGAGMNLLNLKTMQWDSEILNFTASNLSDKLPRPVPGNTIYGQLNPYFKRYGFCEGIPLTVWSGDNPSSLIGTGGDTDTAIISLGTSDTFFTAMKQFQYDPEGYGHIFGNPAGGFMSLTCFTNGSLARERIIKECGISFTEFDIPSGRTPCGKLICPYFEPEITPLVPMAVPKYNFDWKTASVKNKVRAIQESQALRMKLHSDWQACNFKAIIVTGGASGSLAFRQIIADVFQTTVKRTAVKESAALGAALRAANATRQIPFDVLTDKFCHVYDSIESEPQADYGDLLKQYRELEKSSL